MNNADLMTFVKRTMLRSAKAFINGVEHCSRRQKKLVLCGLDLLAFVIAIYVAFGIHLGEIFPLSLAPEHGRIFYLSPLVKFAVFYAMGMYRGIVRFTQSSLMSLTVKSVLLAEVVIVTLLVFTAIAPVPRTVIVLDALLTLVLVIALRTFAQLLVYRLVSILKYNDSQDVNLKKRQSVLIYGAGQTGFELAQALRYDPRFKVVGFLDDNPHLWGHDLDGIKINNSQDCRQLSEKLEVYLVLLAIPSASPSRRQQIVDFLKETGLEVKTVPSYSEILSGQHSLTFIRDIEITDLLGREEVLPDPSLLEMDITHKTVLVTGAGGSIGSELCRQIAQQNPKEIILYELNEFALYSIDIELSESFPQVARTAYLGSVADRERLTAIFNRHRVETVYHAAAYKHVPLVELNPAQGILNNVFGTLNCALAAQDCQVERFVLISTDKAVRPTNIMGSTKRIAELILQAFSQLPHQSTQFIMVRFGNVLDSNGSVVPRFRQLIKERRPITLTHLEITRYFMSIPEAARLVIQAGALGEGGEVFLLDMGEPVKIYDLATQMIALSGLQLGRDIQIVVTGLRPGEKLYEELLIEQEGATPTRHPKIYSAREAMIPWPELSTLLDELLLATESSNNKAAIVATIKKMVPEYSPQLKQEVPTSAKQEVLPSVS